MTNLTTSLTTKLNHKLTDRLPGWLVVALVIPLLVLDGWAILLILEYFGSIVTAFAIATLLAFILNYPVQTLEKRKINRTAAIFIVFLVAVGVLATLGVTLIPLLVKQVEDLVTYFPDWLGSVNQQLRSLQDLSFIRRLHINLGVFGDQLEQFTPEGLQSLSNSLLGFALGTADGILTVILTLALTLYVLLHGKNFWDGILQWLPANLGSQIKQSLQRNFQGYFVGQITVALIQGTVLTFVYWLLNLPYFLLFGMGIGLLVLIPFFDLLGILAVSLLIGLSNFWLGMAVLALSILLDQIIDNGITPRVLGNLVGLNPIWIILSLLIGAKVAGFLGIILAIPLAGTIQNVVGSIRAASFTGSASSP